MNKMELLRKIEKQKGNSICPKCNKTFQCFIEAGKSTCWCFNEPIKAINKNRDNQYIEEKCLCKECIKKD